MPGPNSAPNGDAGLVMGHPAQEFVCNGKGYTHLKHKCGDDECRMVPARFMAKRTGKTAKNRG